MWLGVSALAKESLFLPIIGIAMQRAGWMTRDGKCSCKMSYMASCLKQKSMRSYSPVGHKDVDMRIEMGGISRSGSTKRSAKT